jgi:hypothetical protein
MSERWAAGPDHLDGLRAALEQGGDGDVVAEQQIADWLARLRLLHGVPFHHLVPDARMLRPESIRFFMVDENWVDALVDGAFSIGRTATRDAKSESHAMPAVVTPGWMSGFVIRSSAVATWSRLEVRGFADLERTKPLTTARLELLAADLLLCLFDGQLAAVTFTQPAETAHLSVGDEREAQFRDGGRRVLDVERLAAARARGREPWTAAELASALVPGVSEVVFEVRP